MASFELADTVKALKGERTRVQKELTKLDSKRHPATVWTAAYRYR